MVSKYLSKCQFPETESFELCYIGYVMNCAIWYVMEISKTFHLTCSCFPTDQKSVNLANAIHEATVLNKTHGE